MPNYQYLIEDEGILAKENLWYSSDTSKLYKVEDNLYKVSIKHEPFYRHKLDYLLAIHDLDHIGPLPQEKIKTNLDHYGFRMKYLPHTKTLWTLLKEDKITPEEMINTMIILSEYLKEIHRHKIKFSDLHHKNIVLQRGSMRPFYLDFDDAVIDKYSSCHISCMSYNLHDLEETSDEYKDRIIKDANLDRENLFIIYLNYLLQEDITRKTYEEFQYLVDILSKVLPNDFVQVISTLKPKNNLEIPIFEPYIGDYLKEEKIKQKCLAIRR